MPRLTPLQYALLVGRQKRRSPAVAPPEPMVRFKEAELHDVILAECRRRGYPVIHSRMDRASTVAVGAPDFVIALPGGRTLWLECKTPKGTVSDVQDLWLSNLRDLDHQAHVVRSVAEFLDLLCLFSPQAR